MKSRARGKLAIIGFKLLVVAFAGLMLTGCGDALLIADFDNDPVGKPPPADPPGWPYGDRIYIPSFDIYKWPPDKVPIMVVTPSLGGSGNAARYFNFREENTPKVSVYFVGRGAQASVEEYWVVWAGQLLSEESSYTQGSIMFRFALDNVPFPLSLQQMPIAWFEIDPDQEVELVTKMDIAFEPTFESLGKLTGRHVVVFHFDVATRQYELTIMQGPTGPSGWLKSGLRPSLQDPLKDLEKTMAVEIQAWHAAFDPYDDHEIDYNGKDGYYIDGIEITESCPDQNVDVAPELKNECPGFTWW